MELIDSWLRKKPIAHRGLHSNDNSCPENSIEAFKKAIELNFPIELDVHILKDDRVVVFHDDNLKRVTNVDKQIESCNFRDIKGLKLSDSNAHIPLLSDVVDLVNKKVPILIELKSSGKVGRLEEAVLMKLKDYKGEFAIQSFNPFSVEWYRIKAPKIIRGQLSGDFKDVAFCKKFFLSNLLFNIKSQPHFINYEVEALPKRAVEYCRKKGMPILGWTIRSQESLEKSKLYCDNGVFENFIPS